VVVALSITTNREDVRRVFEPRCPPIQDRVSALRELHMAGVRTQASLAPLLPCDPLELADLVGHHCDWVVSQSLKIGGSGARTRTPALKLVEEHGWLEWLAEGVEARRSLEMLRDIFGRRFHEGREGFGLSWYG